MGEIKVPFQSFVALENERELDGLYAKLKELDEKSIRALRAIYAKTATMEDAQILSAIEAEIIEIRKRIKELEQLIG